MIITDLSVSGVRNLQQMELQPCPGINQLIGPNGAGKTSVLEAVYLLATGHTFRTRKPKELLPPDCESLSVTARLLEETSNRVHQTGLSKSKSGETQLKLDYQPLTSISEMSRLMPVKALFPDSHRLVQESPDFRRQFMDWALFHVEQHFFSVWKDYRRSLQQRNQALRLNRSKDEVAAWDESLAQHGETLHELRKNYVEQLQPQSSDYLQQFGLSTEIELRYRRGWAKDTTLIDALRAEQDQHPRSTFTTVGPHRAEMALLAGTQQARHVLSRGEQKCLVYALHLAQLQLLGQSIDTSPIVLCDDLAAELDKGHREMVLQVLAKLNLQTFISGNTAVDIPADSEQKVFAIERGKLSQVI